MHFRREAPAGSPEAPIPPFHPPVMRNVEKHVDSRLIHLVVTLNLLNIGRYLSQGDAHRRLPAGVRSAQ